MPPRARGPIRPARSGEEERLAVAARRAFQVGTNDGWHAYFRENPHLREGGTLLLEEGETLRGQASALRFEMKLAGADVPMLGFAAVAVAPEHRRAGVATDLMKVWLTRLHREREGLALLYPFQAPFYGKLGFGRCEWLEELWVVPAEIPASPLRRRVRPVDRTADLAVLEGVYAEATAASTGPIVRSSYWWRERVLARCPEGVLYEGSRGPEGYLLYDVPAAAKSSAATLVVKELAFTSPDAFRGLLGFVNALGEQVTKVALAFPRGEAATVLTGLGPERPLVHYGFLRKHGHFLSGAMARLVHLETALALHPGPARVSGRLGLDLSDPVISGQSGSFDVELDGRARLRPGRRAKGRLQLPIDVLAAIYMGSASARTLVRQGFIGGDARAAELLDAAFSGPPPFLWPMNGF